jgi:hypothetical protein
MKLLRSALVVPLRESCLLHVGKGGKGGEGGKGGKGGTYIYRNITREEASRERKGERKTNLECGWVPLRNTRHIGCSCVAVVVVIAFFFLQREVEGLFFFFYSISTLERLNLDYYYYNCHQCAVRLCGRRRKLRLLHKTAGVH